MAKFNRAKACQLFLQEHYRRVDVTEGRNSVGDIWWDKPIDDLVGDWEVKVNFRSERVFVNTKTGETSKKPPPGQTLSLSLSCCEGDNVHFPSCAVPLEMVRRTAKGAMVPMRRKVVLVKEDNPLNKNVYYKEYEAQKADVALYQLHFRSAATIQKYARRKLVYNELARLKLQAKKARVLKKFFAIFAPRFKAWRDGIKAHAASKVRYCVGGYGYADIHRW